MHDNVRLEAMENKENFVVNIFIFVNFSKNGVKISFKFLLLNNSTKYESIILLRKNAFPELNDYNLSDYSKSIIIRFEEIPFLFCLILFIVCRL